MNSHTTSSRDKNINIYSTNGNSRLNWRYFAAESKRLGVEIYFSFTWEWCDEFRAGALPLVNKEIVDCNWEWVPPSIDAARLGYWFTTEYSDITNKTCEFRVYKCFDHEKH